MPLPRLRPRPHSARTLRGIRLGLGRADRVTLALASATALTAGAVLVGEFARRLRARAELTGEGRPADAPEATAEALQLASRATQDTVRVAIEGYESGSRQEVVLFNLLGGFAGSFAVARLSTSGIRSGWATSGSAIATSTTSCPGSRSPSPPPRPPC